ncbi:ComEC/Rec2 family competence protein [Microbacterium limosum]|uniref:ComEC/Rec2 family competence protein n=1 Tax=Microbacterium limosum TaxID=3079935 RepID=A0AAU0MJ47_9MICO|nr:ComEC/Rec2 family competence protein [Microbacterium sp. Y20]WOQ70686.1 ComEC/Rec2 family competence protein [Microbacterium sp. Y20]
MTAPDRAAVWSAIAVTGAVWAAASLAIHVEDAGAVLAAACLPGAVLALAGAWWSSSRSRAPAGVVLLVAALALAPAGAAGASVAIGKGVRGAAQELVNGSGRAVELRATVTTKVEPTEHGGTRFDARVSRLRVGDRAISAPLAVRVIAGADSGEHSDAVAGWGAVVDVRGRAIPAGPGERAVVIVFADEVELRETPGGLLGTTADLRAGLREVATALPGPGGGLLPGLAIGDTAGVDPSLRDQMQGASLTHLTAVSGANCAIVVALVYGAARALRAPRALRLSAAGFALAGFVALVTPEPSVVRAATMAAIALIALAWGRPAAGLRALVLAVVVILVLDPWLAASLGFALSAAATASLLLLAAPLTRGLARWMPRPLAAALAIPLSAQLVCGPLVLLVDPVVPIYGVPANLLAGPAAPLATIVGLLACLAQPVPPLAVALAWVAWVPSAWIAAAAEVFSTLPGARAPWPLGAAGMILLAAIGVTIVVAIGPTPRRAPRMRALAGIATAILVGTTAGWVLLARPLAPLTVPEDWSVAQCDVGQGDAVLLRSSDRIALIDTGPDPSALRGCLDRLGVGRIDLLVLTHFDLDHVGAVDAVEVGAATHVLHAPASEDDERRLLARLAARGATLQEGRKGARGALGAASWHVLWPEAGRTRFDPGNDTSVVIEVERDGEGMPRGLYLGDLSAEPQRALEPSLRGAYDIVKVAHHGSADQQPSLYERAGATLGLVGVGADNDYGHPRQEILDILAATGTTVARSDADGLVLVDVEADGVRVWREHVGVGGDE